MSRLILPRRELLKSGGVALTVPVVFGRVTPPANACQRARVVSIGKKLLGAYIGIPGTAGDSQDAYNGFVSGVGSAPQIANTYNGGSGSTWHSITTNQEWQLGSYLPTSCIVLGGIQLFTDDDGQLGQIFGTQGGPNEPAGWQSVISGQHDSQILAALDLLGTVARQQPGNFFYVRWNLEYNGQWRALYNLTGGNNTGGYEALFVQSFQYAVGLARRYTANTGTQVINVWNPGAQSSSSLGQMQRTYPGNSYVDVIGIDVYADTGGGVGDVNSADGPSLVTIGNMAIQNGKPLGFCEVGAGAGNTAFPGSIASTLQNLIPGVVIDHFAIWSAYLNGPGSTDLRWWTQPATMTAWMHAWNLIKLVAP